MTAYDRVVQRNTRYSVVERFLTLITHGWPIRMSWRMAMGYRVVGPKPTDMWMTSMFPRGAKTVGIRGYGREA